MTAMTETETYNGWKNYPTWAVNLWLSNDEGLYNHIRALVEVAIESNGRIGLADEIQDFIRDLAADATPAASFITDLLGYALDSVDWFEIADAWLSDSE